MAAKSCNKQEGCHLIFSVRSLSTFSNYVALAFIDASLLGPSEFSQSAQNMLKRRAIYPQTRAQDEFSGSGEGAERRREIGRLGD